MSKQESKLRLVVDIDGTICTNTGGDYRNAVPFPDRILKLNELHDSGVKITYFTARGMGRTNNSVALSYLRFYVLTRKQLKNWGARFDSLYLGKPSGDRYIDDKAVSDEMFFSQS